MAGTLLKWLIPAFVTVVGGTALAVAQTGGALTTDLSSRVAAVLDPAQFGWATVTIEGRDAVISGTVTTRKMIDDAVARVAAVRGVRAVSSEVALAELVSPFPFEASLKDGKVSLAGAYPDETIHRALLSAAGDASDSTELFSGAPDGFEANAKFALAALNQLDEGTVQLADLSLTVTGRAKSIAAFDALQTLQQSAPPGLRFASLVITPPIASPYVWTASFNGTAVTISGDTPDPHLADQLRAIAPANVPVSTSLELASGEPSGFAANTLALLTSLLSLESGEASIRDGVVTLSGAPATSAVADQVTAALTKLGGTATLEPPRVTDYALGIEKSGDRLVFSGFVPDAATRDKLGAMAGADISKLALGRGATDRFASALDFGLSAIIHLADGRFDIKGDRLSIGGRAATVADYKAAAAIVGQGAPQGLTLSVAEIHPPIAKPFTWSAVKDQAGHLILSGFVPGEPARTSLHARIADLAVDSADPADGAPENFVTEASKGLDILVLLDTGSVTFDGANWAIDGTVSDTKKGFAADAAYSIAGLRTAGWSYAVHLPPAPVAVPLPTIAPYVWRAQKTADGSIGFTGFAPAEAFQRVAKGRAPSVADNTVLGAGAPRDFGTSALAGLDALLALDEGSLGLSGARWTLTGVAADSTTRETIQNRLTTQIDPANWTVAIQAKDSTPIVTPYLWSATKAADATVELTGYVPTDDLKALAASRAGSVAADSTTIASGEPAGFADDLSAGLDALAHLRKGRVSFDGSKWMLAGEVASQADGDAAMAALTRGSKGGALWTSTLEGLAPPPSSELPPSSASSAEDVTSLEAPTSSEANREIPSTSASEESSQQFPETPFMEPKAESSSEQAPSTQPPTPTSLETVPPMPTNLSFEATRAPGAAIALKGSVPTPAAAAYFASIAGEVPTDALDVASGLPDDFITNALAGINSLSQLGNGHLGFDGSRWWLRGKAETKAGIDAATAAIAALPKGTEWSVSIDLLSPIEVCREKVDALAQQNAILFKAGKPELIASSMPTIDELAIDLGICPNTNVHVQGHTDGDGDQDVNLALSVSRAETVVSELIKRGIAEARLYAEGYGESDPVVPNDSKENKAKNRRIAFSISEE